MKYVKSQFQNFIRIILRWRPRRPSSIRHNPLRPFRRHAILIRLTPAIPCLLRAHVLVSRLLGIESIAGDDEKSARASRMATHEHPTWLLGDLIQVNLLV